MMLLLPASPASVSAHDVCVCETRIEKEPEDPEELLESVFSFF